MRADDIYNDIEEDGMHDKLTAKGYTKAIQTQCLQAIDDMLRSKKITDSETLMALLWRMVDGVVVFGMEELDRASSEYFGVVRMVFKEGEVVVIFPWLWQYLQGECIRVYRKGIVGQSEIDVAFAGMIECAKVGQRYLM